MSQVILPTAVRAPTYSVSYRLATTVARSSIAVNQVANTDRQWATLHHAATATKLVRIQRVAFVLTSNTVAAFLDITLTRITTAPATGNPAVAPKAHNSGNPATECTALILPTTAGTVDNAAVDYSTTELSIGATTAPTAAQLNPGVIELVTQGDVGTTAQGIELRPGVLEGVVVIVRANAATTLNGIVRIVYTEE